MKGSVFITLVALLLPGSASAQQSVEVLSVINGQQLLIELDGDGRSLRLACLQAPRPSQQPWADQADAALNRLVQRGDRGSFDLRARDVYGRLVGRLEVGGGDVGAALVEAGAVFPWNGFVGHCDDLGYERLAESARREGRGVWSIRGGLRRPWDVMEATRDEAP